MDLTRKSGVLAHPTSFQSKWGIGDLGKGTYDFIDFLVKANQKIWQILPLGPTSFGDSPYQCFSTFAGNHFLISLDELVSEGYLTYDDLNEYPNFNDYSVEYGEVIKNKNKMLYKAFENFKANANANTKKSYKDFEKNARWIDDYALFMALKYHLIAKRDGTFETPEWYEYKNTNKDLLTEEQVNSFFYGACWNSWPKDIANRDPKAIKHWQKTLKNDIEFHKFLQFEFYRQWINVKTYANEKGIEVIGDIPIFVAMDSADVWANQKLFYMDQTGNPTEVAGVPPDYFSATGQLWGNPLYNWANHKKEGYKWWISRIQEMLSLVDTIRIDHFRGFDEYWAIPYGEKTAINGEWKKGPGIDLFKAVDKALGSLPIIAEDLGVLTDSVEKLRDDLNLPGMKILQFAFDDTEENDYLPHNFKNSNCIAYSGTHDNDTSLGWYLKATELEQDKFRRYMNVSGQDPAWDLIRLAWSSTAAYAITPVQDLLSLDSYARTNTPGEPSGNWQFRFTTDMLHDGIAERLVYLNELFDR